MGVSATKTALARIKELDSSSHEILSALWEKSFSGEISQVFVNKQLSAANLLENNDKDIKFVIDMVKRNISAQ